MKIVIDMNLSPCPCLTGFYENRGRIKHSNLFINQYENSMKIGDVLNIQTYLSISEYFFLEVYFLEHHISS